MNHLVNQEQTTTNTPPSVLSQQLLYSFNSKNLIKEKQQALLDFILKAWDKDNISIMAGLLGVFLVNYYNPSPTVTGFFSKTIITGTAFGISHRFISHFSLFEEDSKEPIVSPITPFPS